LLSGKQRQRPLLLLRELQRTTEKGKRKQLVRSSCFTEKKQSEASREKRE